MSFELVIFDCDGVLVDSELLANRALAEALGEIGVSMTTEQVVAAFMGRSRSACLVLIEERLGRPVPEGFAARWRERTEAAFRGTLRPVSGIAEALERIALPVCVASSSDPERMRTTLDMTGLLPRFEGRLFSAVDVARGKPHPDLFLHAARRMGAPPGACAVVEDTELGVRAAVAAGMTAFGFARLVAADTLAAAGAIVFRDMRELPDLLAARL